MKEYTKSYLLLIVVFCPYTLAIPPSCAGPKTQDQPMRTVRVTTGIEATQGWEQGLVRANPNLARWHWDPIYSYRQGYMKLPVQMARPDVAKNAPTKNRQTVNQYNHPAFQYPVQQATDSRPTHVPFSPKAMEEVRARWLQPEKPVVPINELRHEDNVGGRLVQPVKETTMQEPTTATYGELYSRRENTGTALKYSSQKTSVYGQLLNTKVKSRYNGAKTTKKTGH